MRKYTKTEIIVDDEDNKFCGEDCQFIDEITDGIYCRGFDVLLEETANTPHLGTYIFRCKKCIENEIK